MIVNLFKDSDRFSIKTNYSLEEIKTIFNQKIDLSEKTYNSIWNSSFYAFNGIFCPPNKYQLKKSALIPNIYVKNQINVELKNSSNVELIFTINNVFAKLFAVLFIIAFSIPGAINFYKEMTLAHSIFLLGSLFGIGILAVVFLSAYFSFYKVYFKKMFSAKAL